MPTFDPLVMRACWMMAVTLASVAFGSIVTIALRSTASSVSCRADASASLNVAYSFAHLEYPVTMREASSIDTLVGIASRCGGMTVTLIGTALPSAMPIAIEKS